MTTSQARKPVSISHQIGFTEFVVLVALMMACQALAIDAMLPSLPTIAHQLGVTDENRAQWIVLAYMAGMGVGQLFWGLLSDRFGRRAILLVGLALYVGAALLVGLSGSFATLLSWRFIHGIAASSAVVARSMIRDLYEGRTMARVMSLTFIVFMMIPVVAPSIGQLVLLIAPWRTLFVLFGAYGAVMWLWVWLRLPETLHPEYRMTLDAGHIRQAAIKVLTDRASICNTFAVTVIVAAIFGYVAMVQQVFADVFHHPSIMPTMFAVCAAAMGAMSYINSRIVERIGMRIVSQVGLLMFIALTLIHVAVAALGYENIVTFVLLQSLTMSCVGLMVANFGTMAMEPMAAIAGIAASLQGFIGTTGAALLGALVGRQFNGTTLPLAAGSLLLGLAAMVFVLLAERGKLFSPHHATGAVESMHA
ncbi:MAG TPA: multidrug effflux MFS transporter [Steroidobacteraceae bacterium]|nr:multidrug effflux MFS transporter [Steroidobacteraceae bacterium]